MGLLSKLIRPKESLGQLGRQGDRDRFVERFLATDFMLLCALTHPGIPVEELTQEKLLAMTEESAKELGESDEMGLFSCVRDENEFLPVFTAQGILESFIGEFSKERNRVFPFQTIGMAGQAVVPIVTGDGCVILDAGSPDEYELSPEDKAALRLRA